MDYRRTEETKQTDVLAFAMQMVGPSLARKAT